MKTTGEASRDQQVQVVRLPVIRRLKSAEQRMSVGDLLKVWKSAGGIYDVKCPGADRVGVVQLSLW